MTRRRWTYTDGGRPLPEPVEVSPDYQRYEERQPLFTDRWREGSRATDGTDIGSRAKERDYMKATGLAHASDFAETWQKANQKKSEQRMGVVRVDRELKDTVGRAAYEAGRKKR
jgi:hypothetical protein